MSRLAAAVLATVTGLAAALIPASPAAAHARLLGSTPKDGSTATKPVAEIRLRFSEAVRENLTTVRITGPDGAAYGEGGPVAVDATVTQAVAALPAGAVKVGWRTVSVDGHTIQGNFTFTNRAAPADPAPSASVAASAAPASPTAALASPTAALASPTGVASPTAPSDPGGPALAAVAAAVVAVLIAAAAGLWWRRRRRSAG
jgi:methionine-rich copper-binding protein CopC